MTSFRIKVCPLCGHECNFQHTACRKCKVELTDNDLCRKELEVFY